MSIISDCVDKIVTLMEASTSFNTGDGKINKYYKEPLPGGGGKPGVYPAVEFIVNGCDYTTWGTNFRDKIVTVYMVFHLKDARKDRYAVIYDWETGLSSLLADYPNLDNVNSDVKLVRLMQSMVSINPESYIYDKLTCVVQIHVKESLVRRDR